MVHPARRALRKGHSPCSQAVSVRSFPSPLGAKHKEKGPSVRVRGEAVLHVKSRMCFPAEGNQSQIVSKVGCALSLK